MLINATILIADMIFGKICEDLRVMVQHNVLMVLLPQALLWQVEQQNLPV